MALMWTPDLEVGIKEIDDQHKELFSKVNDLLNAMSSGNGKEEVERTVRFLGEYVAKHFSTEEKIMERYSYPNISSHKTQHVGLVGDFVRIKDEIAKRGASSSSTLEVNRKIVDWLRTHIGGTDKTLGAYLKEHMS